MYSMYRLTFFSSASMETPSDELDQHQQLIITAEGSVRAAMLTCWVSACLISPHGWPGRVNEVRQGLVASA